MKHKPEIILALDVDSFNTAQYFFNKLYPKIKIFKVGPVLFTACGHKTIDFIHKKGAEVFLDLKFYDIPNTVANAVRQVVHLKVKMLTLHILGGREMLMAAAEAAKKEAQHLSLRRPLLIGVTVLTSQKTNPRQVLQLAKIGFDCGLDGIVCSVHEASMIRKKFGKDFLIITAGIRPKMAVGDDQKRTATASEAVKAGSNFLVVGRPILNAKDPLKVVEDLL